MRREDDPEAFLRVKESLLSFIMTLESYSFPTNALQKFILVLFEKYATMLESHFGKRFESVSLPS